MIVKKKYVIYFLVIVFILQLLELASAKIGNSTIFHYLMYTCYFVMTILLLTVKKDKTNLSFMGRIKRSLFDNSIKNLIIDSKEIFNDIIKIHLPGSVSEENKKLEK